MRPALLLPGLADIAGCQAGRSCYRAAVMSEYGSKSSLRRAWPVKRRGMKSKRQPGPV
jgi:hypothetical protein